MQMKYYPDRTTFGLLPEPEGRAGSFFTSLVANGVILALLLYIGATAKKVMDAHKYEYTELIVPLTPPPPPPPIKIKVQPPRELPEPVKQPVVHFEAPKIKIAKPEPKPDLIPFPMPVEPTTPWGATAGP